MNNTHTNNITKTASADMSKGTVVKLDGENIAACAASDAGAIGVIMDDVKAGDNVAVALLGIANHTIGILASATISAGANVCLDANGKVKAGTSGICIGIALTAGYANAIVEVAHRTPQTLA